MKVCARCGVVLTPAHGGPPRRLTLAADNGHATTVDLCGEHYGYAVRGALEALLGPPVRDRERLVAALTIARAALEPKQ